MSSFAYVGLGALFGAAFSFGAFRFLPDRAKEILAVLLAVIASIYAGPAIGGAIDGSSLTDQLELTFAIGLVVVAIISLRSGLGLLALGYLAHGVLDIFHGGLFPTDLPHWYAPMCVGYDWAVAAFLFMKMRTSGS